MLRRSGRALDGVLRAALARNFRASRRGTKGAPEKVAPRQYCEGINTFSRRRKEERARKWPKLLDLQQKEFTYNRRKKIERRKPADLTAFANIVPFSDEFVSLFLQSFHLQLKNPLDSKSFLRVPLTDGSSSKSTAEFPASSGNAVLRLAVILLT